MSAASKYSIRSEALSKARRFFHERGILEVDPPLLSPAASIDAHIDLFSTMPSEYWSRRFLFSSPEYPMKRLLSEGAPDIYYLGHVFREEPQGRFHSPEFLMAEWYRLGYTFLDMVEETAEFTRLFLGNVPLHLLSYKEAFLSACSIDPFQIALSELVEKAKNIPSFSHLDLSSLTKDDLLNLFLTEFVEPSFKKESITALIYYPKNQAALAKTIQQGDDEVSERFELFFQQVELANGYHELTNANEQKCRLIEEQQKRIHLGKDPLILDDQFIEALEKGLPDCCGVAVGVDRLIMLEQNAPSLSSIQTIPWK